MTAAEQAFNDFIKRWVAPAMQPHLLDSGDNAGEKVRRLIRELARRPEPQRQDATERTCEICGRVGTRRYIETATGWRCSPTATACPGNLPPADPEPPTPDPNASHIDPISGRELNPRLSPNYSGAADPAQDANPTAAAQLLAGGNTAACSDCTRTWTLTGRQLRMAIDTHEFKKGHVVEIAEGADRA